MGIFSFLRHMAAIAIVAMSLSTISTSTSSASSPQIILDAGTNPSYRVAIITNSDIGATGLTSPSVQNRAVAPSSATPGFGFSPGRPGGLSELDPTPAGGGGGGTTPGGLGAGVTSGNCCGGGGGGGGGGGPGGTSH